MLPDITYKGVWAGYTRTDLDGTGEDANSLSWRTTYQLSDRIHLWGSIDRTTFEDPVTLPEFGPSDFGDVPFLPPTSKILLLDLPALDVSVRSVTVAGGAGVHHDLTDRLSVHARLGFVPANKEIETSGFELRFPLGGDPFGDGEVLLLENAERTDETSTDLVMSAGLRFNATERVELFGGLSHVDGEDTAAHADIEFRLGSGWGIQLAGVTGENSQGPSASVIWRF